MSLTVIKELAWTMFIPANVVSELFDLLFDIIDVLSFRSRLFCVCEINPVQFQVCLISSRLHSSSALVSPINEYLKAAGCSLQSFRCRFLAEI